jgi:hypothetical protein
MPGYNYATYVNQIALLAVVDPADPNFVSNTPSMIEYAELRILRDLDLLVVSGSIEGYFLTVGSRQITIPMGTMVVSEQINVITPYPVSDPELGARNPMTPTTKEYLDMVYGDSSVTGLPEYYVPFNDNLFLVGPFPDANYYVEIIGTVRPPPLSVSNPTTFISQYLPDLFTMASMVYVSGYQRNFGRQSDDPQMAQSYEQQYKTLLEGAVKEEVRKKYESVGWSSMDPSPLATPTRG